MIDYVLRYADEAAAKTALSDYLTTAMWPATGLVWRNDCIIANPMVIFNDIPPTGFSILVSKPLAIPGLLNSPNLLVAIDRCEARDAQVDAIIKSNLSPTALQRLRVEPTFAGADYRSLGSSVEYSRLSFSDDFDSASTIDMSATGNSGFNWYRQGWFGGSATPQNTIQLENSTLTLTGALHSATSLGVGSAFRDGAYFEASIAFEPSLGALASAAWPAFWSIAIEHVAGSAQWEGQPIGYNHFIELDFFEAYHRANESYAGKTAYFGTIHDWSGVYNSGWPFNIQNSGNNAFAVGQVNWSDFHKYGCLWMPSKGENPGYVQWFFDDVGGPRVYWKGGPVQSPPLAGQESNRFTPAAPDDAAQTYAAIDTQGLALVLSTDPNWPMMVDWVKVWQAA